ncbi:MAG: 5-formyltetrahydrofolate cyclo-ligase [Corynebacterium sp.]|nr:5-formyltetrahydrofolate cyclo-ligase [Corynebacterium sp.]
MDPTQLAARKQKWRTQIRDQRAALTEQDRRAADAAIRANVEDYLRNHLPAQASVASYLPSANEPGGAALTAWAHEYAGALWLPKVVGTHELSWGQLGPHQELHAGNFGIMEPSTDLVDFSAIPHVAAVILPGLGATPTGRRLGQGGGYYDRLLAAVQIPKILVLYAREINADIPFEAHDIGVDVLITEAGVLEVGSVQ